MGIYTKSERETLWDAWGEVISAITVGEVVAATMPSDIQEIFRENLRDIPLRDALLAQSARNPEFRPALREVFAVLAQNDDVPSRTLLAAMQFLDGDMDDARANVSKVLETEDYSLARLLDTGLAMQAPASMLARSFSHFEPTDLLND